MNYVYRTLKYRKFQKVKILSISSIIDYDLLKNGDTDNIYASPKYENSSRKVISYPTLDIKLFNLNNVFCNINSTSFITKNMENIFIEEFPLTTLDQVNYSSGFIKSHDSYHAYIRKFSKKSIREYKNIFFLGGNGSFNFYHWMLEIVPKVLLLNNDLINKKSIDAIIVNECVKNNENYLWLLEKCISHLKDIDIIYISQDENFFAEKIFFLNTFNQTVYNFKEVREMYKVSTVYNKKMLDQLKTRICKDITNKSDVKYRKIYILRNEESVSLYNKRSYNESEIFSFFKKEGFTGIYPDKLALIEQVSIFKNAEFIVGPSGASWSNIIFSEASSKAISWLPEALEYFDTYSTLGYLNNIDMKFIKYKSINDELHSPYSIELKDIIELYYSMI